MFFTDKVTVRSAASAVDETSAATISAVPARSFFIGVLRSRVEQQGGEEVEANRGQDQDRGENERALGEPVGRRTRADAPIGAALPRGAIDQPVTRGEKAKRRRNEIRLIGGKLREVADPRAADAEAKQDERQD